jgi:redox-sensitive bicupin YhaK (pirin superfamily)
MIEHRPKSELGGGDFGWLKALHHFHIGGFGNPAHRALGNLYVWNDDTLAPGAGFPMHSHRDVEIVTYVREGYVSHSDSLGSRGRTAAGDVQVMSAGAGIEHAEVGAPDQRTSVFQIWLRPRQRGGEPRWGSKPFPKSNRAGRFVVLASGFSEDTEALMIRADARVLGATLMAGQRLTYNLDPGRKAYLVPTSGKITIGGAVIEARDGAAVREETALHLEALADTEVVMVESV